MSVVELRPGHVRANDVPGFLRALADRIESGEVKNVRSAAVVLDMADRRFPGLSYLGELATLTEVLGLLEAAKYVAMDSQATA